MKKTYKMNKKKIIIIFVFCLLISFICGLPHIIGWSRFGQSYSPLGVNKADAVTIEETYTYAPRVVELLEKNQIFVHDPYVYENRNKPSPFIGETFPAYLMVLLAKVFGSVSSAFIVGDFIFPLITAVLVFFLLIRKTNSYLLSLTGSTVVVFLRDLLIFIPYPMSIINYLRFKNAQVELLPISRSFHSEVSLPILLLFIVVLHKSLESKKRGWIICAGIIFGLLFYTYIFYWTTATFALILLLLWLIFNKKKAEYKIIAKIIILGIVIGTYYFYNMFLFTKLPEADSFLKKSTLPRTGIFFIPSLRFLLFFIFIFIFKKKKNNFDVIFLSLILSASLLPDITYYILGRNLEGIHWVRRLLLPMTSIFIFSIIPTRKETLIKLIFGAILFCSFYYGINKQLQVVNKYKDNYLQTSDLELISYLNKYISKNQVIGSMDKKLNRLIPALTTHYDFIPESIMTISGPTEILERYLYISDLCRIKRKDAIAQIKNNYGFNIYYFLWGSNYRKNIKEINSYDHKAVSLNFRLNYLIVNKLIIPSCQVDKKKIYNNKIYSIYKIE